MRFPKSARLHHRSLQERLFSEGSKIHEYPLKLVWNALTPAELEKNFRSRVPSLIGPVQVLVSVPKKKRRKAVDRVLMRRRIREAYRLNRTPLLDVLAALPAVRTLSVGLVYMKEANSDYAEIEEKMIKLLTRLGDRVTEKFAETELEPDIHPTADDEETAD